MSDLYKKLNISALDVFKFNRCYKFDNIMSRKKTSGDIVESTYLKVADDSTYIYANESSPLNNANELSTAGLSEVCIKYKDNNEYKYFPFYIGYSLTYTQNVNVTNLGTYMYAYDYISSKVNENEINKIIVNINHDIVNGQKVNKFSDVVCSLKNDNLCTLTNGSNEINLKLSNIKSIIDSNNYGSASFGISYSYVTSSDGRIHEDGKCIVDELTGVHVWSMNSYIDDEQYSYQDRDYTDGNSNFIVYTYINASQTLLNKLENSGTAYLSYALVDVSDENWWSQDNFKFVKASNDQTYLLMYEETKQQFFTYLRPYNLTYNNGNCVVDYREPFSNIYRYSSWRDNKDYFYACQEMKTYVGNLSSIYPKLSDNFNNFNTSYFIKKIGNLPVHIVPPYLKLKISCNNLLINGNNSGNLHILHNLTIDSIDFRIESRINQNNNTTSEDLSIPINVEFHFETINTNNYLKAYVRGISHTSNIGLNEYINEITYDIAQSTPSSGNEEISYIEITFNMYKIYERIENYSSFIKEIYTKIYNAAVQLNNNTYYTEITKRGGLHILEPSQPEYDYAYSNSAISADEIYINAVFNNTDGK